MSQILKKFWHRWKIKDIFHIMQTFSIVFGIVDTGNGCTLQGELMCCLSVLSFID